MDWRIRTAVPVVALHLSVFASLYFLSVRFVRAKLLEATIAGSAHLLDEGTEYFRELDPKHSGVSAPGLMNEMLRRHPGIRIVLFDSRGQAVLGRLATDDRRPRRNLFRALHTGAPETSWVETDAPKPMLSGIRLLRDTDGCRSCHTDKSRIRGALLVQVPLGNAQSRAATELGAWFGGAGLIWLVFMAAMHRVRERVIGRPLERIGKSVRELEPAPAHGSADLDGLADAVSGSVARIVAHRRTQETQIATGMVRAEQLATLGELAAGLSHEIRNPLAGIRTALEVLRKEDGEATRQERDAVHSQMISELDRVTRSLDALLRLARPRAPQRTSVDLSRLARNAVALFEPQARDRHVNLGMHVEGTVPPILLDPDMMMQLLVNLLTNALHAIKDGGRITVEIGPCEGSGIALSVTDDGVGIPQEALERVFEPFFTTKPNGTGLGLAICRQIVEQHGGRIEIDSRPGGGTRVVALLASEGAA